MRFLYISYWLVWEPKLDRAYCCELAPKMWFFYYISKLWIWNDNSLIDCWLCCLIIVWLIKCWTYNQIESNSELYWNSSHLHAYTCTYIEQVLAKRLEQKNKIVCPTNRYMFTIIYCFVWVMMILWADWLAAWLFLFLFEIRRPVWQFQDFPVAPGAGEVMAKFFENLGC